MAISNLVYRAVVFLITILAAGFSMAQEAYPSARPVTMVVAFPPGGAADLTARPMAIALESLWKQRVIVENRGGASGGIGNAFVARSKPDGYTLLMALSSVTILPEADRVNGRTPSYELNQLVPLALVSADPTVLVVRSELPYNTLKDFISAAKANPGKINYSSSGNYGALHTPMEMLSLAAGIKLFHIPYQGGGPAVTALLGAQVAALASGPGPVVQHIKAGKLRPLATWGDKRHPALPDVPTLRELGVDNEFYIWAGLFSPVGVPDPVTRQVREAVRQAVGDAQFRRSMDAAGQPVQYLDAPEFKTYVEKDARKMADVVRAIGKLEEKN